MPTPTPTPTPTPPPPTYYPHNGTDCGGNNNTIYTTSDGFSISDVAYGDNGAFTYSGYFIYNGIAYSYGSGNGYQYSYSHAGTDCIGDNVTIYTSSSFFQYTDVAYSNACLTEPYNGYFYNGITYNYIDGLGDVSTCPTPTYTNPNILKADIHASYETGSGTWQSYRTNVTGLFVANSGTNQSDYRDHVIREFNRKISILNQPTGLFISPYDDGFRFTGVSI
jgi:hypothetical protein